ncbi:succinate dehydrogenase / fumarate reductase cytochrome b subunit [Lishizhenia tianjinensis]|uniref:Succinate dehydrogenase / fumarate reductase cytochrome b subunit n=2 Tax=Lishizhenia tianjinensis TaxID=477690 RepID=A0A1I6ZLB5_9FLAO|nr:succinate dehydrogenase / fumarate reductase cytochrome b subunit [Lishizhenia tianjinensis]
MALSAFFLMLFLLQHFAINMMSVVSPEMFNETSHFMGTNPMIQYLMQPILIFAVVFHFVMGFILEARNKAARNVKYAKYNGAANASWFSRNMLVSGLVVLAFLGLHFYDFWLPEVTTKFVEGDMTGLNAAGEFRYFEELQHKFVDGWRVAIYCVAFVLLAMHLMHGFNSAFQSTGIDGKMAAGRKKFGTAFAIIVPLGFVFIALFHFLTQTGH